MVSESSESASEGRVDCSEAVELETGEHGRGAMMTTGATDLVVRYTDVQMGRFFDTKKLDEQASLCQRRWR